MIALFPLWRRRWWVESRLSTATIASTRRAPRHAVMNRPNKLAIPCKRARVLARSDHLKQCRSRVEPGIPTELPAASRPPGPSKTRSAAIHRCGKNGARLRRPQCGRMRKPSRNRPRRSTPPSAREETTTRSLTRTPRPAVSIGSCPCLLDSSEPAPPDRNRCTILRAGIRSSLVEPC